METCICVFILSISTVVLGLVGVAVFALFCLIKRHHLARVEIDHAKIALKKQVLKERMQKNLTREEYEIFCEIIKRFEL
jgi:uncharacterized membrane protein